MIKLNRYQTAALSAIFASEGVSEDLRLEFQGRHLAKVWPRYQLRKKRVAELREMGLIRWEYPTETASGRWVLTRPGTTRLFARG